MAAGWIAGIVVAMAAIAHYTNSPSAAGTPPAQWPAASQCAPSRERPTLLMFAHPHCPCTRASIGELDLLMAQSQGRVDAHVFFIQPAGMSDEWTSSDLWQKAKAIPGVAVHRDPGGAEASRFGSATSGQTLLYDRQGRLIFEGGITLSRGHSGDNPGRSAILALLDSGASAASAKAPVFGCSLFDEGCQESSDQCKQ